MRIRQLIVAALIGSLPAVAVANTIEPTLNVEFILDASGSMNGKLQNQSKMRLAKVALSEAMTALDSPLVRTALRAYGFDTRVAKTPEASCPNSERLVDFGTDNLAAMQQKIAALTAYGYTPLARSLRLAGEDLLPYKEDGNATIVLISDGKETCGGDPEAEIRRLRDLGFQVRLHVIGFDLDAEARTGLKALALAGGGEYYDAGDGNALGESLRTIIDEVRTEAEAVQRQREINPVSGGQGYDDAVSLKPGRYTLTEHLPKATQRYFFVPTGPAQRVVLTGHIQTQVLTREMTEGKHAAGGFTLRVHDPIKRKPIKGRQALIRGDLGESGFTHYFSHGANGVYFTVGDDYVRVNKDVLFEVRVEEAGDGQRGVDAPAKDDGALPTLASGSAQGYLGLEDREDTWLIRPAGNELNLTIRFDDAQTRFRLEIRDARSGKRISRINKLRGEKNVRQTLPGGVDAVSVQIRDNNPGLENRFGRYQITLNP